MPHAATGHSDERARDEFRPMADAYSGPNGNGQLNTVGGCSFMDTKLFINFSVGLVK
jgi:hypothetical protein